MQFRLGLDLGVVMDPKGIPVGGLKEGFARLRLYFDNKIYIFATGPEHQWSGVSRWVVDELGLPQENLFFSWGRYERIDDCNQIGITHYVDIMLDRLLLPSWQVPYLFWFGLKDAIGYNLDLSNIKKADNWVELVTDVIATIELC